MGYSSQENANYAAYHLSLAAERWNEYDLGVRFKIVPLARDANFVICHGGNQGPVLASAFFPNSNTLNYVFVYSLAFEPSWKPNLWKPNLWKVLTHELRHVSGLRHEFAMNLGSPRFEGSARPIGTANP